MPLKNNQKLKIIDVHTDWDLPLVSYLYSVAIISVESDCWDGVQDEAMRLIEVFGDSEKVSTQALRGAFNNLQQCHDILAFDPDDEESHEAMSLAEAALAKEILEYFDDVSSYVIVHAIDEDHGDEAWYLCFIEDVQDLGIDKSITA